MDEVTTKMTHEAIKVLVGEGILPKHTPMEVYERHWEAIKKAIEAANRVKDQPDY